VPAPGVPAPGVPAPGVLGVEGGGLFNAFCSSIYSWFVPGALPTATSPATFTSSDTVSPAPGWSLAG